MKYEVFTNSLEGISKISKKIQYFIFSMALFSFASCGNNEPKAEDKVLAVTDPRVELVNQINSLEAEMHSSMQLDNTKAGAAIKAYTDYARSYPTDSLSPDYLFKAAEILTAIQQYAQALAYYQNITDKYPTYKLVEESLFLQGAILDNFLNDDVKAKVIYEQLLAKYPKSKYTADAKAAINNLGKSDEELIKEFKKKNGEK